MNLDEAKDVLAKKSFKIKKESRLGNDTGWQLLLENGGIVNVYDTGTVYCQGKKLDALQVLLGKTDQSVTVTAPSGVSNKVFVVYGHDNVSRTQLEAMLRRWRLEPLILDQLPSEGQTIIEKLENNTEKVGFAVVLVTPDDVGYRDGKEDEKAFRARQNVVLELGILLHKLGRSRVAILMKDQKKMEKPSDIQGLIYLPFKDDLDKEAGKLLAKEMDAQGYRINMQHL